MVVQGHSTLVVPIQLHLRLHQSRPPLRGLCLYECFQFQDHYSVTHSFFPSAPDIPGNMWVCPRLWFNDLDYRAGIFVHELTHFLGIGDTGDKKYGSDACKRLARDDPDLAIKNADNYKFFALAGTGRPTID